MRENERDSSNFSLCVYKRASARTCVCILVFGPTTSLVKGSQQRQKQRAVRPRSVLSWSSAIRVCKDSPFAFEVDWNVDVRTRVCTRECVRNKVEEEEEKEDDDDDDDDEDGDDDNGDDNEKKERRMMIIRMVVI